MRKKQWTILGLALGTLVLGVLVGLMTVGTVAADPTPGVKIQVPRIDVGEGITFGTGPWETWIQVQNVGTEDTGAIFFGWGEYSGKCPTNDPGVIVHYCAKIRENALWTLRTQISETVKSGIIYTVTADAYQEACSTAELTEGNTDMWREWLKEWEFGTGMNITKDPAIEMTWGPAQGEEIAVTVTRYGPNDYDTFVSSTYTGISGNMEGEDPPYDYYAPYVMKGYNGLDTEITIQNSGQECTSVWIDYLEQGTCYIVYSQHIEQLAPGEAKRVRLPCNTGQIPCLWLGSAHISAEQPLGIIVDETSFAEPCPGGVDRGTLLTHRARPKIEVRDSEVVTDTIVYADLLFREWNGWESSIQVQNVSRTGLHTFVTVDFMDNSGDEILFLGDWVCANGSTTFHLPSIGDLIEDTRIEYVGAAEIQSHSQVDYPGGRTPAQPIFAVVDLKKPRTAWMDAQGGSYNAHPYSQKEWVSEIALPFVAKDASDMYTRWTSLIAIRNNSNCNKIKPKIWFKKEDGALVCEINSFWLRPKHVKLIDLDNLGCLIPGYIGAAKVIIEDWEQLCDVDNDGHIDNEPIMPSVIVVERGVLPLGGDVTNIYEGIPYATNIPPCYGDIFGSVAWYDYEQTDDDPEAHEPLQGADVEADTGQTDTTSYAGGYELMRVEAGLRTVTVEKFGYYTDTVGVELDCGADTKQDFLLVCQGILWGIVTDEATGAVIEGAEVTLDVESLNLGQTWPISATTDVNGIWWMFVPLVGDDPDAGVGPFAFAPWDLRISKDGYDVFEDLYVDTNENEEVDKVAGEEDENIAFADEQGAGGWNADDCVGADSEGCTSDEDFCDPPNDVFEDHPYVGSVTGLNPYATVQGRVYCDGLVVDTDPGVFNPGEEQPNVLVKLLNDGATTLYDSMYTNANGFYQFTVGEDLLDGFDWLTNNDLDVCASTECENADNVDPGHTVVINIDICP